MENNAVLVLADGTVLEGYGFGSQKTAGGEVVFNTSMTGYQEALTDPSYKHQILLMTYPLVGNYGIREQDFESTGIQAEGLVIRELNSNAKDSRIDRNLDGFLKEYDTPGIQGVDTRFLTRKIRLHGVLNGILKYPYEKKELEGLKEKASKLDSISEMDLLNMVSTKKIVRHDAGGEKSVVLIDCGVKNSIINLLMERKVNVIQVPAKSSAGEIMDLEPDAILVSNGPGDPQKPSYVVESIKELVKEELPLFGICLGLQLISIAYGVRTYKLKFGHRGSNHPVKDLKTGRSHITSQNHGFAVDADTLPEDLEVSHISLNDGSVEGIKHRELPVSALQYHPEGHPGPWYNYYLFDEFVASIK
ncbi:MAG: glutamine-hydrolyzing carbamoyl-phosphate synthase small subunit [Candidatus Altiarchaeota archaeon]|nr:glutamine-hydrolyzing carbamoyl-phosphate synthase small subunit [Candidatus Altiarchaeota archaeon]